MNTSFCFLFFSTEGQIGLTALLQSLSHVTSWRFICAQGLAASVGAEMRVQPTTCHTCTCRMAASSRCTEPFTHVWMCVTELACLHTCMCSRGAGRHNCLNCWERDLVKAILIQPGHICLLHTQSICLKDINDCNLTAIERDCNEVVTICLMWACCSKVGRIIKGMVLYFLLHYVQWQPWGLMSMRFISFSMLFCLFFFHSYFSFFVSVIDWENSLCITSAVIIPFITWWRRWCLLPW